METVKSVRVGEVEFTALTDAEGPFFELGGLFPGSGFGHIVCEDYGGRHHWQPLGAPRDTAAKATQEDAPERRNRDDVGIRLQERRARRFGKSDQRTRSG